MPEPNVLESLNEHLGKRNRNIDRETATVVTEKYGAEAIAEHVDAKHAKEVSSRRKDTDRPRNPDEAINEDQHELLADVKKLFDDAELAGGIIPATALQMHPWAIPATGPHNTGITLPTCPIQDEYVPYVQKTFRRDFGDRWGRYKVSAVWPITILRDFQKQHEQWGGIVVYMGDHLPGQTKNKVTQFYDKLWAVLKKVNDKEVKEMLQQTIEEGRSEMVKASDERLSDGEIKKLIVQANDTRILWYESMYSQAEQVAADPKGNHRVIQNMHRQIARWMVHRGRYAVPPGWVSESKPRDFVEMKCPKCGASVELDKEGKPRGFCCVKCNYILDGIRAYEAAEPGYEQALKRCSREELDAAGLKHIKTLTEERAEEAAESEKKAKGKKSE